MPRPLLLPLVAMATLLPAGPAHAGWELRGGPFDGAATATSTRPATSAAGAGQPAATASPGAAQPALTDPPAAVVVVAASAPAPGPAVSAVGGRGGDGGDAGFVNVAVGEQASAGNGGRGGDGGDATVVVGQTSSTATGEPGQSGATSAAVQVACRLALAIGAGATAGNGATGCIYALAIGTGASAGNVAATVTALPSGDPAAPWAGLQQVDDLCGAVLSAAFCEELDALTAASGAQTPP
jgi:hypothetical protein